MGWNTGMIGKYNSSNYKQSNDYRDYRMQQNFSSGKNEYYPYPKQKRIVKHSGCTVRIMEDGSPIVSGWKVQKRQMLSLYARPYKGTKKTTSKSGIVWMNLFVTIINRSTMQETQTSGLYNCTDKKLYMSKFNMIANPKGGKGGYWGKHISSSYNR